MSKPAPLFRGKCHLPPHFTPHQVTDIGSKVYRLIQGGWSFGDAFNTIAHQRMIFKSAGDGRYEQLKSQVEEYCRGQDFHLTFRAKYLPRNHHLTVAQQQASSLPLCTRLKPGIEVEPEEPKEASYLPRQTSFNFSEPIR